MSMIALYWQKHGEKGFLSILSRCGFILFCGKILKEEEIFQDFFKPIKVING